MTSFWCLVVNFKHILLLSLVLLMLTLNRYMFTRVSRKRSVLTRIKSVLAQKKFVHYDNRIIGNSGKTAIATAIKAKRDVIDAKFQKQHIKMTN